MLAFSSYFIWANEIHAQDFPRLGFCFLLRQMAVLAYLFFASNFASVICTIDRNNAEHGRPTTVVMNAREKCFVKFFTTSCTVSGVSCSSARVPMPRLMPSNVQVNARVEMLSADCRAASVQTCRWFCSSANSICLSQQ